MGWGEAETEYNFIILFVWFVFVYMFLPQEPENVQFYLHFPNKESVVLNENMQLCSTNF